MVPRGAWCVKSVSGMCTPTTCQIGVRYMVVKLVFAMWLSNRHAVKKKISEVTPFG